MKPRDSISISDFKATCLAVLERVRKTGRAVLVTRRGEPVAEIVPPSKAVLGTDWVGSLRDSARIEGDLVAPATDSAEWDAVSR